MFANDRDGLPIVPKPPQQGTIAETYITFDNEWEVYIDPEAKEASDYVTSVLKECGVQARFTARKNSADLILDIQQKISKKIGKHIIYLFTKTGRSGYWLPPVTDYSMPFSPCDKSSPVRETGLLSPPSAG